MINKKIHTTRLRAEPFAATVAALCVVLLNLNHLTIRTRLPVAFGGGTSLSGQLHSSPTQGYCICG